MKARHLFGFWIPLLSYSALIYYLSSQRRLPSLFDSIWDKALHTGAYAVLAFLALRAFHGGVGRLRLRPTLVALAFTILYGVTDEFHQSLVAGRDASPGDLVADAIGALVATLAVHVYSRWSGAGSAGESPTGRGVT